MTDSTISDYLARIGQKGGKSTSAAKKRAAIANGKKPKKAWPNRPHAVTTAQGDIGRAIAAIDKQIEKLHAVKELAIEVFGRPETSNK